MSHNLTEKAKSCETAGFRIQTNSPLDNRLKQMAGYSYRVSLVVYTIFFLSLYRATSGSCWLDLATARWTIDSFK